MKLHELSDNPGSRKKRVRVGRGIGSGKGKTGGRGVKGQKSRSGVSGIRAFEGGQMPLYMRLPKRGFNKPNRAKYVEVNIGRLQAFIDAKKLSAKDTITAATLIEAGVIRRAHDGIRILGTGELTTKISIEAVHASASAKAAIEKAGGKLILIEGAPAASAGGGTDGFFDEIDRIVLIDGIGPKTEKALEAAGLEKLTQLVALSEGDRAELFEKLGVPDQAAKEEWVVQAQEMIDGKPPRSKVDQDLVAKIRKKASK